MIDFFANLKPDTTLLTPNRRLSATLSKHYALYQQNQGHSCWPRLDILPLSSWLERLWSSYGNHFESPPPPRLLSNTEVAIVWEDILRASPIQESCLQLTATAELAQSAWATLQRWQVSTDHPLLETTEDSLAFKQWAEAFEHLCQDRHWLDSERLMTVIIELINQSLLALPRELIILGFTEYTPQQKILLATLEAHHVIITVLTDNPLLKKQSSEPKHLSLPDEQTELVTMARWAKQLLATHSPSSITIGCIVPRLDKMRERVLRIFTEVFTDETSYTLDSSLLPFNLSAGKALHHYPVIGSALAWLHLYTDDYDATMIGQLLHSPFLGEAEEEAAARALYDSYLRQANISRLQRATWLRDNAKINLKRHCPLLAKRLTAYNAKLKAAPAKQPMSAWVPLFLELLAALGWPGEQSLTSHEYQTVQRWLELLQELLTLDHVLPPQPYALALHYLKRLTAKTIFQPQSQDAPVQILGMLEAVGLPYDYLWVMGLDDKAWPAPARPHPLLPHLLQKTLHMPHATAERELTYSLKLTEQLKHSAASVIFSHAKHHTEGELRPSTLITPFAALTFDELALSDFTPAASRIFATQSIAYWHDTLAPAVKATDAIRGGAAIFKKQAACPFKAFAELRLKAKPLETTSLGLRPQERGTLIHKALELIWNQLKDSCGLARLTDAALTSLLQAAIQEAIATHVSPVHARSRYLALEQTRIQQLLWDWLQLEKARPPFAVVAHEHELTATLSQLTLHLRVDRIDELEDGTHLIIDYKTGKYKSQSVWFSDRPEEPQLPLYCISHQHPVAGIAFAYIGPQKINLEGISRHATALKHIKPIEQSAFAASPNWEQQVTEWRHILTYLGDAFYQGNANLDPHRLQQTCRTCKLHALCRIHEYETKEVSDATL